jgi:hypothetical protein
MAAIALGLYSNRIDWTGTSPAASTGNIKELKATLTQQGDLYKQAVLRKDNGQALLARLEESRASNQRWYAEQLQRLLIGKPGQVIAELTFQNGRLQMDRNGLPVLTPSADKRLQARNVLVQDMEATQRKTKEEIEATQTVMKQEADLTFQLNGKDRKPKGLRDLLADTLAAEKQSVDELTYIKKQRIHGREAAGSLLHRQRQLRERVETIKKEGIAAQAP